MTTIFMGYTLLLELNNEPNTNALLVNLGFEVRDGLTVEDRTYRSLYSPTKEPLEKLLRYLESNTDSIIKSRRNIATLRNFLGLSDE